jgi:hypothetical protein
MVTPSRIKWNIEDYVNELINLYELQESMAPSQWEQLFVLIKNEMIDRFPADVRSDHGLTF